MIIKTIKVAGVTYNIVEKPFIDIDGSRDYQGVCIYPKLEIAILSDISQERKEQTLVHELTHAMFYEAGFEGQDEQDEEMISRFSNVLYQVLKDNDGIV
ncbi:hypothetical protein ACOJIU_12645 [Carnobacterium maltaromaticum]|uniref:hypothetical protein n=1 Tax=Carnobacterium maltaromaticum TaxID=2751 RepID=UPI003B97F641